MLHKLLWHAQYKLAELTNDSLIHFPMHPIQGTPGIYRREVIDTKFLPDGGYVETIRCYGRNKNGVEYTIDQGQEIT